MPANSWEIARGAGLARRLAAGRDRSRAPGNGRQPLDYREKSASESEQIGALRIVTKNEAAWPIVTASRRLESPQASYRRPIFSKNGRAKAIISFQKLCGVQ